MAAGGVWKRSSHADFGSPKQQEYHFPPFRRGKKDLNPLSLNDAITRYMSAAALPQ